MGITTLITRMRRKEEGGGVIKYIPRGLTVNMVWFTPDFKYSLLAVLFSLVFHGLRIEELSASYFFLRFKRGKHLLP